MFCGGVTSVVSAVVIGRVWAACDVGVGASANSFALVIVVPAVWVAVALSWVFVFGVAGRLHRGAAWAAGAALNTWLLWFTVVWLGILDSYPDPVCPGNVPPWWPALIPV